MLLVKGCEPVRLEGTTTWTLLDFCSCAAHNAECHPRRAQILTTPIPCLHQPQVVITDQSVDSTYSLVPVDLRVLPGGDVFPIPLRTGMATRDIVAALVEELPDCQQPLQRLLEGDGLHFQDAEGFMWESLPHQLHTVQWLALRIGESSSHRRSGGLLSTTTTTWASDAPSLVEQLGSCQQCAPPLPAGVTAPDVCPLFRVDTHSSWPVTSAVDVVRGSSPPLRSTPTTVPPEGPPPDPERDPRTPPGTARGPSASRPSNGTCLELLTCGSFPQRPVMQPSTRRLSVLSCGRAPNKVYTRGSSRFSMLEDITPSIVRTRTPLCKRSLLWRSRTLLFRYEQCKF